MKGTAKIKNILEKTICIDLKIFLLTKKTFPIPLPHTFSSPSVFTSVLGATVLFLIPCLHPELTLSLLFSLPFPEPSFSNAERSQQSLSGPP